MKVLAWPNLQKLTMVDDDHDTWIENIGFLSSIYVNVVKTFSAQQETCQSICTSNCYI